MQLSERAFYRSFSFNHRLLGCAAAAAVSLKQLRRRGCYRQMVRAVQ